VKNVTLFKAFVHQLQASLLCYIYLSLFRESIRGYTFKVAAPFLLNSQVDFNTSSFYNLNLHLDNLEFLELDLNRFNGHPREAEDDQIN